jgi:hypothetical protein
MQQIYYLFYPSQVRFGRTAYVGYIYKELDGIRYEYIMCEQDRIAEAVQQLGKDRNIILSEVKQDDLPHPNAPDTFILTESEAKSPRRDDIRFFAQTPAPYGYWQKKETKRAAV